MPKNCPSKATGARSNGETGNMFRNAATNVHQAFWSTATHHNTVPAIEPTRYTVNRNAQSRGSCSRFNRGIFCSKLPCQFSHTCNKCNQGHRGSQCQSSLTLPSFLQHSSPLPTQVHTTINIKFQQFLSTHPDRELVRYGVHGLYKGFDISFTGTSHITKPKNLKSAGSNETSVDVAIDKELARGHTSGPFRYSTIVDLHCSPIGGIIKKDGSCRLIMDLSQPKGLSINEGILKEDFTVQYSHFDVATKLLWEIGSHCLMSKVDIKHAFRLLPVSPEDWKLLGYFWKNLFHRYQTSIWVMILTRDIQSVCRPDMLGYTEHIPTQLTGTLC